MSLFQQLIAFAPGERIDLANGVVFYTDDQVKGNINTTSYKLWSPNVLWHDGKTYLIYMDFNTDLPYGQARMTVFDEEAGFDRMYNVGQVMSAAETHQLPVGIFDDADTLHVVQENVHNTPLDRFTGRVGGDWNYFVKTGAAIGTNLAYPNPLRLPSGNFVIWSRGTTDWDIYVTFASSGFTGWGTQRKTTDAGSNPLFRHYPCLPFGHGFKDIGGWFYCIVARRVDDGILDGMVRWYRYYILKTQDHLTYWNYGGTHSHTISVDGVMDEADLIANYIGYGHSDSAQGFDPTWGVTPDGKLYGIQGNSTEDGYVFIYWNGSAWADRPVDIPNLWTIPDYETYQWNIFRYLFAYSETDIQVIVDVNYGAGEVRQKWFRTANEGLTWEDFGFVAPDDIASDIGRVLYPANFHEIPENRNFAIWFSAAGDVPNFNALYGKIAAKGTVQSIPGLTITPASSMSRGTGNLFHYKCIDGQMTRSGNNVTALTDQFALRSAFGTNNPQWNGSDAIDLNGTNNYFSINVSGLTALTQFVLMGVFKIAFQTRGIVLCLSKNSTTDYVEYSLCDSGPGYNVNVQNRSTANGVGWIHGQDRCDDGNYHVVAFVTDGQSKHDIYVDGKLQYLDRNSIATLGKYQQIGDCSANIATINSIRIGSRDSTSDEFTPLGFKEIVAWSEVMPIAELREKMKKLCNDHGITYQNQFQLPS